MKKNYLKLIVGMMAAIMCVGFASCDKEKKEDLTNTETPIDPVDPTKGQAMSPEDQKETLEQVAKEFMSMTPASDFDDIADLYNYINDYYGDDYDWDEVEDWADDAFEVSREFIGSSTDTETYTYGSYIYKYNYINSNYKVLILASNFTGHFTASNGRWKYSKASDLQFIFKDQQGRQCILKLETSGSVKKVHLLDDKDWKDYTWENNGYTYISNEYIDRNQYTIGIPERIVVTLTQGGETVVKTTVTVNLSGISSEEFNLSKSSLSLSAVIELNNGYKFNLSNVTYSANSKASVSFAMTKNSATLLSIAASGDVSNMPSVDFSDIANDDFDDDDFENVKGKNAFAKVDVMGKLQVQGTLSDVRKYADYLEQADDYDDDEKNFKSYINQANDLADVSLFYNGTNVRQATVRLEPFIDEQWGGRTYWEAEPVIYFFDGSSYSSFEAFFNEKDFRSVIDTFKKLANRYADLVGEDIDW